MSFRAKKQNLKPPRRVFLIFNVFGICILDTLKHIFDTQKRRTPFCSVTYSFLFVSDFVKRARQIKNTHKKNDLKAEKVHL